MKNTIVRFAAVAALSLAAFSSQASVNTYMAHGSVVAVDAAAQQGKITKALAPQGLAPDSLD